ncbi:hypothetical protein AA0116_g12872 [Alternaria tenuissima]|nr:hypothetical protein AA0116_g12872 [Alternaria tenuissima]
MGESTHGSSIVPLGLLALAQHPTSTDIPSLPSGSGYQVSYRAALRKSISASVGVSGMAFPWCVREHLGGHEEMLVQVDMPGDTNTLSGDAQSWAPLIDAATSISSCILSKNTTMCIVSGIDTVIFVSQGTPPKTGYLLIERRPEEEPQRVDVEILGVDGTRLCRLEGMQFTDLGVVSYTGPRVDPLLYRLAWVRPSLRETPLPMDNVILISADAHSIRYLQELTSRRLNVCHVSSVLELEDRIRDVPSRSNMVVLYVPGRVREIRDVAGTAHAVRLRNTPELWGGLIDHEGPAFPFLAFQCVQEESVIRVEDGQPHVARMASFHTDTKSADPRLSLLPRPDGTYVVTGGLGDLGLETLEFLAKKGARRIVVVSRRLLSPQQDKPALSGPLARIQQLRSTGVKIHVLKLDISEQGASAKLTRELERLSFVPVSGVVHAAAVPGFGHIRRTPSGSYASVMAPKVAGALALHEAFPPGTLDFFVFFSSISGIVGTPGHAAYAASNTFLDGLAAYRRSQGCNSIAMLWTAWRGLGLASNTAVVDSELQAAGMGDITAAEAFDAWERLSGSNTEHAVVTPARAV